jgi:hypothetical protein
MSDVFTFIPGGEPADFNDLDLDTPKSAPSDVSADEPTLLARLKSSLAKKVARESILLEVPERPEMVVRYSPNITQHQVKQWRKNSGSDRKEGMDSVRFSCHVLANTCTGLLIDGQEVTENGVPMTFSYEAVMSMLGVSRVFDCVREMYGLDPHVEAAAIAVLDAAGFNDSVEQVDPTKTS